MKRACSSVFFVAAILFLSCSNDRSTSGAREQMVINRESMQYDSGLLSPVNSSQNNTTQNPLLTQQLPVQTNMPPQFSGGIQPNTANPFDTAAQLLARGLNPPHGAAGHRCDLKVGEPLNSKPATQAAQTKPGINPAHGQPGHRCDIAVGAPLDSKPVTTTVQPNATPVQPNVVSMDDIKVGNTTAADSSRN